MKNSINPRYTFEAFVPGESNRLACELAKSIARRSGTNNPGVIFGGGGRGKTHLLHSIGNEMCRQHPKVRLLLTTSTQFVQECVRAVQAKKLDAFRARYRSLDCLLVEDINLFIFEPLPSLKERVVILRDRCKDNITEKAVLRAAKLTQGYSRELVREMMVKVQLRAFTAGRDPSDADLSEGIRTLCDQYEPIGKSYIGKRRPGQELAYILNELVGSGKQVVVTSDRSPKEVSSLDSRLNSRLKSGSMTEIKAPDLMTRIAILRKNAKAEGFSVPLVVIRFVAMSIKTNVRALEGALIRLKAYQAMTGKPLTLPDARDILKDSIAADGAA